MTEPRHEEYQYLELLDHILKYGNEKGDRTGTGTKSIFGAQMRFNLRDSFPLLTTKKMYWKGIVEELLFFIRGETNTKLLEDKGVKIWEGNTSREFLDKHNPPLRYPEGEAGPVYGFQWRNWNGTYEAKAEATEFEQKNYKDGGYAFIPKNEKYTIHKLQDGIDQLANLVETLRTNPNDRRMILTAWNPSQNDLMCLPSCHSFSQFYVANGELSCHMTQRSCDLFLGYGFNLSSYSLLTCILANLVGLKPGDFIWSGGDTHIYLNHIDQCKLQLTREPHPFPKLFIKKPLYTLEDVEKMDLSDFELMDYKCHAGIKAEMAV
jgi:thymidylate synthase